MGKGKVKVKVNVKEKVKKVQHRVTRRLGSFSWV